MKLTHWYPANINPVRIGLYEIRGSHFEGRDDCDNFRFWLGNGWSGTFGTPEGAGKFKATHPYRIHTLYNPGQGMTGWRGVAK